MTAVSNIARIFYAGATAALAVVLFAGSTFPQTKGKRPVAKKPVAKPPVATVAVDPNLPKVTQVDLPGLITILKRAEGETKPLLVNFWATWCGPCREEFPELVKIDEEFKGKIDFITVTLDDPAEINRDVPKFLLSMKAKMPTYLLKTPDEDAAITTIAKDWTGALPFTLIYDPKGNQVYFHQGKVTAEGLRKEIGKLFVQSITKLRDLPIEERSGNELVKNVSFAELKDLPIFSNFTAEKGKLDAKKDIQNGILRIQLTGLVVMPTKQEQKQLKKYGIEIQSFGCMPMRGQAEYAAAYSKAMLDEIARRFGDKKFIKDYFLSTSGQ
jgi:thiol-disulfide isomerase/thioredoxin